MTTSPANQSRRLTVKSEVSLLNDVDLLLSASSSVPYVDYHLCLICIEEISISSKHRTVVTSKFQDAHHISVGLTKYSIRNIENLFLFSTLLR